MTQRGQMGSARVPMRPVTPPAPDSFSLPSQKIFTNLRSTGRGAAADIKSRIRSVAEQHVLHPVFRQEVIERFKLDVVSDGSLAGASDDRIRVEFRAWMAGLGLTTRGDQSPPLVGVSLSPNPKENICLVLDEASIAMLAGLTLTGDLESDSTLFEDMNVRVIDCTWRRPSELKANDTWRGIGDVSIVGLAVLFEMILAPVRGNLETGMMHHLHPLAGMPDY